jgi:hypothetical protein
MNLLIYQNRKRHHFGLDNIRLCGYKACVDTIAQFFKARAEPVWLRIQTVLAFLFVIVVIWLDELIC